MKSHANVNPSSWFLTQIQRRHNSSYLRQHAKKYQPKVGEFTVYIKDSLRFLFPLTLYRLRMWVFVCCFIIWISPDPYGLANGHTAVSSQCTSPGYKWVSSTWVSPNSCGQSYGGLHSRFITMHLTGLHVYIHVASLPFRHRVPRRVTREYHHKHLAGLQVGFITKSLAGLEWT